MTVVTPLPASPTRGEEKCVAPSAQFRRHGKQTAVFGDGVAIRLAGCEIRDKPWSSRRFGRMGSASPAVGHGVGVIEVAVEQVRQNALRAFHDVQDPWMPVDVSEQELLQRGEITYHLS